MNDKPITLDSDTFSAMKQDMTLQLTRLIRAMRETGSEEAAMNVKLTVSLDDSPEGLIPRFSHAVAADVHIKSKKEGQLQGVYTLEEDDLGYVLRPMQTQLF